MPQVPRSAIEYDRSTSRQTAADVRRSVSTTSKSSTPASPVARRRDRRRLGLRRRSTALRTVRTTSSGCSSPNRHSRLAPVSSPAAPASRDVVVAAAAGVELAEHPAQRRRAEPAHRLGGELELAARAVAGSPAAPARARVAAAPRRSSTACRPSARSHRLRVDVVERGARIVLAQRRTRARRARPAPRARRSRRRARAAGRRSSAHRAAPR